MEEAPDADLDAAKAAVTAARSALTQANSALGRTNMYAPFSGTVIDVFARDGDVVAPAVPLLLLADLTTLQVQTTDLSEVDAVRVSIGDTARVSFDALPDATIVGRVTHIALKNSPGAGAYYTVTIKLESIPDNLRWGMSAFVVITVK
jgi:multidrug resistance efflux pump